MNKWILQSSTKFAGGYLSCGEGMDWFCRQFIYISCTVGGLLPWKWVKMTMDPLGGWKSMAWCLCWLNPINILCRKILLVASTPNGGSLIHTKICKAEYTYILYHVYIHYIYIYVYIYIYSFIHIHTCTNPYVHPVSHSQGRVVPQPLRIPTCSRNVAPAHQPWNFEAKGYKPFGSMMTCV